MHQSNAAARTHVLRTREPLATHSDCATLHALLADSSARIMPRLGRCQKPVACAFKMTSVRALVLGTIGGADQWAEHESIEAKTLCEVRCRPPIRVHASSYPASRAAPFFMPSSGPSPPALLCSAVCSATYF